MPSGRYSRVLVSRRSYQADLPAHLAVWFLASPKNLRQDFSLVYFMEWVLKCFGRKKLLIGCHGSQPFLAEDAEVAQPVLTVSERLGRAPDTFSR